MRTDKFAEDMSKVLGRLHPTVNWKCPWCPKEGDQSEHVDLAGTHKKTGRQFLIEVELRRKNPVGNVVKVWRWFEDNRLNPRPVLFQAFSKYYVKHKNHRRSAEFIGREKLGKQTEVRYYPLDLSYNPAKHGKIGGRRRQIHAEQLARKISRFLKRG